MAHRIFYTADVITPDGSDTCVYGDPCEPGHGATLTSGWHDPQWSSDNVSESREDVRPDEFDPSDMEFDRNATPVVWLASQLSERLGSVEEFNGGETFYASDSYSHPYTGVDVRLAAHAEGFTTEELAYAYELTLPAHKRSLSVPC